MNGAETGRARWISRATLISPFPVHCPGDLEPFSSHLISLFPPFFPSCWVWAGIGANFLQRVTDPRLGEPTRGECALVTLPRRDEGSGNRYSRCRVASFARRARLRLRLNLADAEASVLPPAGAFAIAARGRRVPRVGWMHGAVVAAAGGGCMV